MVRPPEFALVNRPDYRALDWIRTHTSPEARFLVKGAVIHEGRSVVGVDAGWWIPLLARRENTLPPQYALLAEKPISLGYSQRVVALVKTLEQYPLTSPSGIKTLTDWGITHVYIGQRQGLSSGWMDQLRSLPAEPTASPFQLVYQRDRTAIFSFHPPSWEKTGEPQSPGFSENRADLDPPGLSRGVSPVGRDWFFLGTRFWLAGC